MISKLLTRSYFFSFIALGCALLILFIAGGGESSHLSAAGIRFLLVSTGIILFFDLLKILLNKERTSYRAMLMEKPLFNPRSKLREPQLTAPLFPRFITLYFDGDDEDPYKSRVYSIQAVRYEGGYLTDSLYLPLKSPGKKSKAIDLELEDALKYLKTYTRDFPLIIHDKSYANAWLREHSNSILLTDAIDTETLARNLYPKLTDFGIEDLNDFYHFEVNAQDPVYGAKITTAVYLDYLRVHNYRTALSKNPFAKAVELTPVYPTDQAPLPEASEADDFSFWVENEPAYQVEPALELDLDQEETLTQKAEHYIGPFTPLDEEGNDIPERGHLIDQKSQS